MSIKIMLNPKQDLKPQRETQPSMMIIHSFIVRIIIILNPKLNRILNPNGTQPSIAHTPHFNRDIQSWTSSPSFSSTLENVYPTGMYIVSHHHT